MQGLDATDPASYSPNLEAGALALGREAPGSVAESDEIFIRIHWGDEHDRSTREHPPSEGAVLSVQDSLSPSHGVAIG